MKQMEMESWTNLSVALRDRRMLSIVGSSTLGIKTLLAVRDMLQDSDERKVFNQGIRKAMTRKAEIKDANFYAYDKCQVKGHQDVIANGYQSLWDNGVDTPVQCLRCGRMEM